ncbi:hypothetical protein, partial [Flavobacterium sp.]|uniref:hypothetical protein n=1 Tax=Flavobacterium sp. TaxID=239 RepID=UPI003752C291
MAYSKITLEFVSVPSVDDILNIGETSLGLALNEIFKDSRLSSGQVTLPVFVPDDGIHPDRYLGFVNVNYKNAFNLDHNSTGLFTVTTLNAPAGSGVGFVTIEANFSGVVFTGTSDYFVDVNIENEITVPAFSINSVTFTPQIGQESNRCTINVVTNHLATKLLQPFITNPNTANPIIFTAYRAMTFNVEVEDSNGLRALQSVTMPAYLNINNFTLDVVNSPSGGTLNVFNVNSDGLDLQYSLDNITWQTSPIFSGLAVGIFMLWVKDQLGYSVNKNFSVTEFGIYTPYFYISKSNSFRFANRITFGDSENYKNDENTLSCEVDVLKPYKEFQQFQSADIITTQFKSNYETNVAKVIKTDLSEIDVPVVKMTNNIGIKDKRDAFKYNLGSGKTGLYFQSGNIYDYTTGLVSDSFVLNGALPEWAVIGNYFAVGSAWFLIEEILFDETKNADVIVFANTYTGIDVNVIAASIYNRFNYEVYEFTIDMVDYIDQQFRVRLVNSNVNFPTITHLSEVIWCKVKHENVLEIKYRNTTNTDIFYSTGIEHKIRIPYLKVSGKSDEQSEVHKTDTDAILLNADIYEVEEFQFKPVTKEIWRKMVIALSHEKVFINGVGYVKNGSFNSEGPLDKSNLYVLTA